MSEQEGKDSFTDFASIDKAPEEKLRGIIINGSLQIIILKKDLCHILIVQDVC